MHVVILTDRKESLLEFAQGLGGGCRMGDGFR
jgi:hypothetical protein